MASMVIHSPMDLETSTQPREHSTTILRMTLYDSEENVSLDNCVVLAFFLLEPENKIIVLLR